VKITETYRCENCDFWQEISEHSASSPLMDGAGRPLSGARAGNCRKDPPQIHPIPVPGKLHGQVVLEIKRIYPPTLADEVCSHHSALAGRLWKGAIEYAVRHWREYLDYRPGKYPDETAAGFSRPPTFDEARKYVPGPDAPKPDKPL
jgi:hypothetical protein